MKSLTLKLALLVGLIVSGPMVSVANATNPEVDALAHWIQDWRGRAESVGTYAVPDEVRKNYRHAFPAGLFDTVRFRVAGDQRVWFEARGFGYGNGATVVLGDIILFRSEHDVKSLGLWHQALSGAKRFQQKGIYKVAATHVDAVQRGRTYSPGTAHKPTRREYHDFPLKRRTLSTGKNAYRYGHNGVVFLKKPKFRKGKHPHHVTHKGAHPHGHHAKKYGKGAKRASGHTVFVKPSVFGKKIVIN